MDQRITVLIPNYNGSRFLPDLFHSLQDQTIQNFKCIFLDDGSSDDSVKIATSFKNAFKSLEILSLENVGIGANWNRGIKLVTTEFFSILHCDDAYEPSYLEKMIQLMKQYPEAALAHCSVVTINELSQKQTSVIDEYKHQKFFPNAQFCRSIEEEYACLLKGSFINCPSVTYRTSCISNIGLFNTELAQVLDWEYWFRTTLKGYRICATNERLYRYRRHSNNATVLNSDGVTRYTEELNLLYWAYNEGLNQGLIQQDLDTSILRNIIILDIANALVQRNRSAAFRKIAFMAEKKLAGAKLLNVLRLLALTGYLGGASAKLVIELYVRFEASKRKT